jgi:alpha-soluble NSF attachment protein
MELYDVAIEKFEQVAAASVDDNLLKWSLKEYFLKAGLCHLCTGVSCVLLVCKKGSANGDFI